MLDQSGESDNARKTEELKSSFDQQSQRFRQHECMSRYCNRFGVYYFALMLLFEIIILLLAFSFTSYVCCHSARCTIPKRKRTISSNVTSNGLSTATHNIIHRNNVHLKINASPNLNHSIIKIHQKRYKINNPNLIELRRRTEPDVYDYITRLFHETWRDHETSVGFDAAQLSHSTVRITKVYTFNETTMRHNYERSYWQSKDRFELPQHFEKHPIKTCDYNTIRINLYEDYENAVAVDNTCYQAPSEQTSLITNIPLPQTGQLRPGEAFLFHGTQLQNVDQILNRGFDLSKAQRGLYGHPRMYLAESSQKADQYADNPKHRRAHHLSMFLVRTALGKVQMYCGDERDATCDTVVGGTNKRFR